MPSVAAHSDQPSRPASGGLGLTVTEVLDCADCDKCGFDGTVGMPRCPLEWQDDVKDASYKAYRSVLSFDGQSVINQLQEIPCTRKELMEHLRDSFNTADPHLFCEEWTSAPPPFL